VRGTGATRPPTKSIGGVRWTIIALLKRGRGRLWANTKGKSTGTGTHGAVLDSGGVHDRGPPLGQRAVPRKTPRNWPSSTRWRPDRGHLRNQTAVVRLRRAFLPPTTKSKKEVDPPGAPAPVTETGGPNPRLTHATRRAGVRPTPRTKEVEVWQGKRLDKTQKSPHAQCWHDGGHRGNQAT